MSDKGVVLVTGGAGFIGSHLCERLLATGYRVLCVDNLLTGRKYNLSHLLDHPLFSFYEQDISKSLYLDEPLKIVIHFASVASPKDYMTFPIQTLKAGSLGTFNMLGLAKAKNADFVLASTSEVYGDPAEHPQKETYWGNVNPVGPRAVYDESKRFAEALSMAYMQKHGMPSRIARIFNTYGPRMRCDDGRAVPTFVMQALKNEPITIHGDGTQTRSFCYIDDLIDGLIALIHSNVTGPINLGNPLETSILEVVQWIIKLADSASPIVHIEPLPDNPRRRNPDIALAKLHLGFAPKVGIQEGLAKTIAYYRASIA
jgi:dTDP-glucose 4,6-dehydratase